MKGFIFYLFLFSQPLHNCALLKNVFSIIAANSKEHFAFVPSFAIGVPIMEIALSVMMIPAVILYLFYYPNCYVVLIHNHYKV